MSPAANNAPILLVQGPEATAGAAAELAALSGAAEPEQAAERAWRLRGIRRRDGVAAWCEAHRLDHAWLSEGRRFADLKLLALDMDSTLITIECIDEIGGYVDKKKEIAEITAQAMRGEIAYLESLRRRLGLLQGTSLEVLERVYREKLQLSPGAERLLEACRKNNIKVLLVSGGFSFFTERLRQRLALDDTLSNVLEIENGQLTGRILGDVVDAEAKAARFRQFAQRLGAKREQTVAIGDGANDLPMMAEAGISIAYRARPVVRAKATYNLDYVGLDGILNLFSL